ncbi:hypothetical protein WOLCODRAFT_160684 [Wolfiporia cocos MD-104 SS10]|uniref:Uncharacterized protein n=1 Tax=Wolfiporia cocos (strain MD-104) TaxID=742152 RepID=A0A2H3IW39_WOLCO|nr:hypothetical protein WOLCODRAFT_160684 [Wolfiporia cocos MD-104 SS10]
MSPPTSGCLSSLLALRSPAIVVLSLGTLIARVHASAGGIVATSTRGRPVQAEQPVSQGQPRAVSVRADVNAAAPLRLPAIVTRCRLHQRHLLPAPHIPSPYKNLQERLQRLYNDPSPFNHLNIMGSVVSAIAGAIGAVVSAVASIIMICVDVVVTIIVTIFDIIFDILCCNWCGGRTRRTGSHRFRRGAGTGY